MNTNKWDIEDLGDNTCVFSLSNYCEDDSFDILYTIQQYVLQFGDFSVISIATIQHSDSEQVDLDVITDFPYSDFMVLNPEFKSFYKSLYKNKQ